MLDVGEQERPLRVEFRAAEFAMQAADITLTTTTTISDKLVFPRDEFDQATTTATIPINFALGTTATITITVTAENRINKDEYDVVIHRAKNHRANLESVSVLGILDEPIPARLNEAGTEYRVSLPIGTEEINTTHIQVNILLPDSTGAKPDIQGADNEAGKVGISSEQKELTIVVTPQDGSTPAEYPLLINRIADPDNSLALGYISAPGAIATSLFGGNIIPPRDDSIIGFTAAARNDNEISSRLFPVIDLSDEEELKREWKFRHDTEFVRVENLKSGSFATIQVLVKDQDGTTTQTLIQQDEVGTTTPTVTWKTCPKKTVCAVQNNIPLKERGTTTTIIIQVTAEDETTTDHQVSIFRLSTVRGFDSRAELKGGLIVEERSDGSTSTLVDFSKDTPQIQIIKTVNHDAERVIVQNLVPISRDIEEILVNGSPYTTGTQVFIDLGDGGTPTNFTIKVTPESGDNDAKTYEVSIFRPRNSNIELSDSNSNLRIVGDGIDKSIECVLIPRDTSPTSIPREVTTATKISLTLPTLAANSTGATFNVEVNGVDQTDLMNIDLPRVTPPDPPNRIDVIVTAEDKMTQKWCSVEVQREGSPGLRIRAKVFLEGPLQ